MNNNGFKNGAIVGSILGASVGMFFGVRMNPIQKRKISRNARKATSTLMNGINSIWR